ncbi:MAG: pilus assembly protein TadG-related protein, partial [Acidobacteria bacterium]|nr:pilus assembly protein TadG-related protein [Acidobacteriota bacterium]
MSGKREQNRRRRGAMSVHLLVILVPVVFGLMGFAVDLGQLYLMRAELKAAANSAALAAGQKLIGTVAATDLATTAAQSTYDTQTLSGNRFYFSGIPLGQSLGVISSQVDPPVYFQTAADAGIEGGAGVAGSQAHYAKVTVAANAPLTFWSFLSLGQARTTPILTAAVAGLSAPVCTACGIEPIAVAPVDAADPLDFGFLLNQRYTFYYTCNGGGLPPGLSNAPVTVAYILLDRFNASSALYADEFSQLYRMGLGGVPPVAGSTALGCFKINNTDTPEVVWATAAPGACRAIVPLPVSSLLCGVSSRFDGLVANACASISNADTIASSFQPESDLTDLDDYTLYAGTGR